MPDQPKHPATRRPSAPALDEILGVPIRVLDHGFVRIIDYMGDDTSVVQAARVSYGAGTKTVMEDRSLIRYLMRHSHTSPFEMAEIKLHVKLPIFVARQWIRHRTANVNEYSARYSILHSDFYIPDLNQLARQSQANRQGRQEPVAKEEAAEILSLLRADAERNRDHYLWMLNDPADTSARDLNRAGLARELARINLTLNTYTEWYWKTDLHNLLGFLRLRLSEAAQYEIRAYANEILEILKLWVPHTYEAFVDYQLGAATLSKQAIQAIRDFIAGNAGTLESTGMTKRELTELSEVLGITPDHFSKGITR